jgi:hypothetical protein
LLLLSSACAECDATEGARDERRVRFKSETDVDLPRDESEKAFFDVGGDAEGVIKGALLVDLNDMDEAKVARGKRVACRTYS